MESYRPNRNTINLLHSRSVEEMKYLAVPAHCMLGTEYLHHIVVIVIVILS